MQVASLRVWLSDNKLEDAWWLCINSNLHDEVATLNDIATCLVDHIGAEISVLHVSKADTPDEEWITIEAARKSGGDTVVPFTQINNINVERLEETVARMSEVMQSLQDRIDHFESRLSKMERPISEAYTLLEERSHNIEQAEDMLIRRAEEHEEIRAELEQLKEELDKKSTKSTNQRKRA